MPGQVTGCRRNESHPLSPFPPPPATPMPLWLARFEEGEGADWSSRQYTLSDSLTNCFPKPHSLVCGSELLPVAKQPASSSSPQCCIDVETCYLGYLPSLSLPRLLPSALQTRPMDQGEHLIQGQLMCCQDHQANPIPVQKFQ